MNQYRDDVELPETPFDEVSDLVEPEEDVQERRWSGMQVPALKPLLLIVGVLLSPIFGLVFGVDVALGVLVVAMGFTSWMAWEGAGQVSPEQADRLRRAAMLNGVIALAGVVLIVLRQVV